MKENTGKRLKFSIIILCLLVTSIGTVESSIAESDHPYANNYANSWTISEPGASQIRIRFAKMGLGGYTGGGYDYIKILDKNGNLLAEYRGSYQKEDFWTEWFTGDTLKVRLETNGEGNDYGFTVDLKETRGTLTTTTTTVPTTSTTTPTTTTVPITTTTVPITTAPPTATPAPTTTTTVPTTTTTVPVTTTPPTATPVPKSTNIYFKDVPLVEDGVVKFEIVIGENAPGFGDDSAIANVIRDALANDFGVTNILLKKDNEITSADKANYNLVLIGGPVANWLTAKLVTGEKSTVDWYESDGDIEVIPGAFTSGNYAIIIAGKTRWETKQMLPDFTEQISLSPLFVNRKPVDSDGDNINNDIPTIPSPSVYLYAGKTEVVVGEEISLILSAVNIMKNQEMTVQLILEVPSGMSVTGGSGSGAGQYTNRYVINPGEQKYIPIYIETNQVGNFDIIGEIYYYLENESTPKPVPVKPLPVVVRAKQQVVPNEEAPSELAPESTPEPKSICGPTVVLLLAALPLGVYSLLRRRR